MNKTYNIILNRQNATTGTNPFKYIFYFNFDWSILPDDDYIVYTYLATNSFIYKTGTIQYPYILLATNAFQALTYTNDATVKMKNINVLGYNYPTTVIGGGLSYAYWASSTNATNNIPAYIKGRPNNNYFFITFLNGDLTDTYTTQEYDMSQFCLNMKFVPVNNKKNIITQTLLAKQLTIENILNKKNKESYNIVLNSNNSYSNVSNKTCKFYFDWSVLPDCAYTVYTTSISGFSGGWLGSSYGSFPVFTIDCFDMENYQPGAEVSARKTTRLASFVAERNANNVNYPTPYTFNEPIYLNSRPVLNDFTITVMNSWLTNTFAFAIAPWVLSLKFVPIV
jgi:hypothetical protein